VEVRDGELSGGSVKVEVIRHAASQQLLQSVHVSRLTDNTQQHDDVFTLRIMVNTMHYNCLLTDTRPLLYLSDVFYFTLCTFLNS